MLDLIKAFKSIPQDKRIILFGKLEIIKNLLYFLFKIIVGVIFKSWLLIAIALYCLFIGFVKANCVRGLKNNTDTLANCSTYIRGGGILAISSIFYIGYAIVQVIFPYNAEYNLIIGIIIAMIATYTIVTSIIGILNTKGQTMLVREYKITNLATAFNNLVLAQIALLSVTLAGEDVTRYNSILSLIVGSLILLLGIYLVIDGIVKKKFLKTKVVD